MTRCALCGNELGEVFFRRIIGWERKAVSPSRRGGSDILLREPLDEFACPACITRLQAGLNVHQEALV